MNAPVTISPDAELAADRYAKLAEKVQRIGSGANRVMAAESFTAARHALTQREIAIMDMAVVKGRTITDLAAATRQPRENLAHLLAEACAKLAAHFADVQSTA